MFDDIYIQPELIEELKGHKNVILSAKFSPDDQNLITAGCENFITFHSLTKKYCQYRLFGHKNIIYCLDYAKLSNTNIQFILSCSRDKTVRLWEINSVLNKPEINQNKLPIIYRCHCIIRFVNTCSDGSMFCTGSDDKTVKVWSTNVANKCLNTFTGHNNLVKCCKFSKNNFNLIASCGDDSSICLYDLRCNSNHGFTSKKINSTKNRYFTYLDWYPFLDYFIALTSSNNLIRIYDLRKESKVIQFYASFMNSVNCVQFNPKGNLILCCSTDTTSKLIDVIEGRSLYTIKGHSKPIFSCCFNTEGSKFITAGMDSTVKYWNLNKSKLNQYEESAFDFNFKLIKNNHDNNIKKNQFKSKNSYDNCKKKTFNNILHQLSSFKISINDIEQRLNILEKVFLHL